MSLDPVDELDVHWVKPRPQQLRHAVTQSEPEEPLAADKGISHS